MPIFFLFLLMLSSSSLWGKEPIKVNPYAVEDHGYEMIKGDFVVSDIRAKEDAYLVVFEREKAKVAKEIHLEAYHVHKSIIKGQKLQISAEIFPEFKGQKVAKARQILLFLERPEGKVPIWLLSKNSGKLKFNSSYFQMHHPDFQIL